MKLLIITQTIDENDPILGFFCRWVEEFAKHCEKVTVICLNEGKHEFYSIEKSKNAQPRSENSSEFSGTGVKVLSLGKEKISQKSKLCKITSKFLFVFNFYKYIWQERKNYDAVFVHMNPEYVVLGGLFWKSLGKKIGLWYAHGYVPFSLKIAEKFTNIILTSTKSGFRLKSKKIKIVGQGIDIDYFKPLKDKPKNDIFQIVTVGRISPIKDYETLINATEILKKEGLKFEINIIGGPGTKDQKKYFQKLKDSIEGKKLSHEIIFLGSVSNKNILKHLQKADLFVNMSHTGSLDKAILEAMACELPVLTCNEALNSILGAYANELLFSKNNYNDFSQKIKCIIDAHNLEKFNIGNQLRVMVVRDHELNNFIKRIMSFYEGLHISK